ncbi:hypothetical protein ABZP36_000407 [Zizania latifolia]
MVSQFLRGSEGLTNIDLIAEMTHYSHADLAAAAEEALLQANKSLEAEVEWLHAANLALEAERVEAERLRAANLSLETERAEAIKEADRTISTLMEVLGRAGTECQTPSFDARDPVRHRLGFLRTAAHITEDTLVGFAQTVGRVAGQGILRLLHEVRCQHLAAATSGVRRVQPSHASTTDNDEALDFSAFDAEAPATRTWADLQEE